MNNFALREVGAEKARKAKRRCDAGSKSDRRELLLRPCSHTEGRCGLEGVHRRHVRGRVRKGMPARPKIMKNEK